LVLRIWHEYRTFPEPQYAFWTLTIGAVFVIFTTITNLARRFSGFSVAEFAPIIREVQKAGAGTLREIAAALNARGVATARSAIFDHETLFGCARWLTSSSLT
jgi:hypothetical protein